MIKILVVISILLSVLLATSGCGEILGIQEVAKTSIESCQTSPGEHHSEEHEGGHCSIHCSHLAALSLKPVTMKINDLDSETRFFYSFYYSSHIIESFKRPPLLG